MVFFMRVIMGKRLILLFSVIVVLGMVGGITVADPGLVCWWKFDGNTDDSSEYENHGTKNGGPAVYDADGYKGQAIVLDGVNDYVVYSFAEQTWSAYTVALWVKTDDPAQDQYSSLFNNDSSGSDFQIDVDGAGNYRYRGGASELFGAVSADWVHLAATCDGVNTTLYFNGSAVATVAAADTAFGQYAVGTNRNTANWFAGAIDEVRVYDRALDAAEIQALAASRAATLLSPADNAILDETSVLLEWERGAYAAEVNGHEVFLSDNFQDVESSAPAASLGLTSNEYYQTGELEGGRVYHWRVNAIDDSNPDSPWRGEIRSFTVPYPTEDPSLVGWWKMDDVGTGTAVDFSGYANDGILKGDPQWVPGHEGDALRFDGVDDWVAIKNLHYESSGLEEATIAAWIRTGGSGDQAIASFDRNEYWRLEVNGSGGGAGEIGFSVMTDAGQADMGSNTRIDDNEWHHVAAVFNKGRLDIYIDGRPDAQIVSGSTFGTGTTRYGFIGARSEAGSFDGDTGNANPFAGDLDDVRIYDRALSGAEIRALAGREEASAPSPADGTVYDGTSVLLGWWPGKYAASHNVYFGTDPDNLLLLAENLPLDPSSYGPVPVEFGQTYYWHVDEVNGPNLWEGDIWSFEVTEYSVVDDFDAYASTSGPDEPSLLSVWQDGSANGTGATISLEVEFAGNSMRCAYDNSESPFYSEAELTYDNTADWTAGGVKALAMEFRGDAGNTGQSLYITVEDADGGRVSATYDDENALVQESWEVWDIALQDFADGEVDLTRVKKLIVGVSGNGGLGTLFIDDIRLYPPRCLPEYTIASFNDDCMTDLDDLDTLLGYWLARDYDVAAVEPDSNRLQAHYKFNETSGTVARDSSGGDYDATVDPNGAGAWDPAGVDGYCLAFNGTFGVTVPEEVFGGIDDEITVSVWVYVGAEVNPNAVGRADFGAGPVEPNQPWDRVAWVQERPVEHLGQWNHYAFVKDAGEGMMRIYHNGVLVAQDTDAFLPMDGAAAGPSRIGSRPDGSGNYEGKLDDFRIYDYALSHAEVLYLALGSDSQLHQPLVPVLAPVDPYADGTISLRDIAVLAEWWLRESLWP